MPIPNSMEKGNLYVIFDVKFPSNHFLEDEGDYKVRIRERKRDFFPVRGRV